MSRLKAIRKHCLECVGFRKGGKRSEVTNCTADPTQPDLPSWAYKCSLYPYRLRHLPELTPEGRHDLTALIIRYCKECMGGDSEALECVRYCKSFNCALHQYRRRNNEVKALENDPELHKPGNYSTRKARKARE